MLSVRGDLGNRDVRCLHRRYGDRLHRRYGVRSGSGRAALYGGLGLRYLDVAEVRERQLGTWPGGLRGPKGGKLRSRRRLHLGAEIEAPDRAQPIALGNGGGTAPSGRPAHRLGQDGAADAAQMNSGRSLAFAGHSLSGRPASVRPVYRTP